MTRSGREQPETVLVVLGGPSSLRYALIDVVQGEERAHGLVEGIGADAGSITHTVRPDPGGAAVVTMLDASYRDERTVPDLRAALEAMLEQFAARGPSLAEHRPLTVERRVDGDPAALPAEELRRLAAEAAEAP